MKTKSKKLKTVNDIITATNPEPDVFNNVINRMAIIINKGLALPVSKENPEYEPTPAALTRDPIAIIAIHIATGERSTYSSTRAAAKALNLDPSGISKCLRGVNGRKQVKGYRFEYADN